MGIFLFLVILAFAVWFYKWSTFRHDEFTKRGLPFEKPCPVFGNFLEIVLNRASFQKLMADFYTRTRHHKIVGFFSMRTPMIQVNHPELIKKISINAFDNFPNHQKMFAGKDRLLNDMLTILRGQRWKQMRNTLTPIFSASKMRSMFELVNESIADCMEHLGEKCKVIGKPGTGFELELKEVCNRLSNDLIATTAFGLKINSYKSPHNEFFRIGQALVVFRGKPLYRFLLSVTFPKLYKFLGLTLLDPSQTDYFVRLVVDTMKEREEKNIVRPDMIQLLMEAKKESTEKWTDDELVAQCFVFFFAAFENNSNFICTTVYELLHHPDIQQRLYEEIKKTKESLKGAPLSYDAITNMKYMDMVVSESLRKWTLSAATDRQCAKDYTLHDTDGSILFEFKRGDRVNIPIIGLHWDERYFPDPVQFNPERFSDENKVNLVPNTYIPFGMGPRICIGNRFALMQVKAVIYNLILHYKIERSPRTVKDILTESRGFTLGPKDGYWTHMVPR